MQQVMLMILVKLPGQPSVAHDSDIDGLKRLAKVMKTRRKGVSSNTSRWCTVIAKLDS